MREAIHAHIQASVSAHSDVALKPGNNERHAGEGTYPQVQREALLDFSLEAVRLDQAVAVGGLAALDAARVHHSIPIKPAQYKS